MNYRKYLTDDILAFWQKHGIDYENGGIHTLLDEHGRKKDSKKAIWFTGRSLWTYAVAYNTVEKKKEYLDVCERLYGFYKKCRLPNGRLPYITDNYGDMLEIKESFHSELFAAIGCAQYYKACKKEEVKKLAIEFFNIVYSMYKSGDARINRNDAENPKYIFGIEMMILFTAQFMRSSGIEDKRFEELASDALYNIENCGFINDKFNITNEYIDITTNKCPNPRESFSCMGHIYAASWIVMSEAMIKKDCKILELGKKLLDTALSFEDEKTPKLVKLGNTSKADEYLWWPQCEAIIAYYTAYSVFGDENYLELAKNIEDTSLGYFADTKNGEWYTSVKKDGTPINTDKGGMIKGPFHLPRMIIAMVILNETGSLINYLS